MHVPLLETGAKAWKDGHSSIASSAFVFVQNAEDMAYTDLKIYAAQQAERYLQPITSALQLTPSQSLRLFLIYVHAFVNGAFDEAALQGEHDDDA